MMGHENPRLSRRALLAGFGAGLAGSSAFPSAATAEANRTEVQLWDLFSGADGKNMRTMIGETEALFPNLAVKPTTLSWGSPYYTKLAMASAGGRPPEAAILHLSRLAGYAPGGLIEPFDLDLLAEAGVTPADFPEAIWKRCLHDGKPFAVPLDTHPFIIYYNTEMADKAGLVETDGALKPITSPEQFLDAGRALAAVTGDLGISYGPLNDSSQAWRLFWGLYSQTGAPSSFTPGSKGELDIDAAAKVIGFIRQMMDGKIASQTADYVNAISSYTSKRSGMMIVGVWESPALARAVPGTDAAPFPTLFGTPANYADSHVYVLPRHLARDESKWRAAHQLVAGLVRNAMTWAEAGHIPAYNPIRQEPAYREMVPQSHYASAADIVVYDPDVWFAGAASDFQNQMSQALLQGFLGKVEPDRAARNLLAVADRLLDKPNPVSDNPHALSQGGRR